MEKPALLRAALAAAIPELAENPDKLMIWIIEGQVKANKATLGHELQYRLNINITDFSGSLKPVWQHWLYDAPYNRHIRHPHRVCWQDPPSWAAALL